MPVVVRFQLGILGCLLAGCAVQPTTSNPVAAPVHGAGEFVAAAACAPPATFALRIGVEHLTATEPDLAPRITTSSVTGVTAVRATEPERRGTKARPDQLARPLHEFAATDDPLAREALHFVSDLVDADRRRVARELGLPFFDFPTHDPDRGPLLPSETALQAEHELWLQENGTSLLQRPMRQLLHRLPIARDLELAFEDFRSTHVPMSEPYEQSHGWRAARGRVSLRVHADDLHDPVEVVWIHAGLRLGSSQEVGKLTFSLPVTERFHVELRGRTIYESGENTLRLDLSYRPSQRTSLHVALGDDMDFLSTSSLYSLFETPMDGSPGIVLYAVHVF